MPIAKASPIQKLPSRFARDVYPIGGRLVRVPRGTERPLVVSMREKHGAVQGGGRPDAVQRHTLAGIQSAARVGHGCREQERA